MKVRMRSVRFLRFLANLSDIIHYAMNNLIYSNSMQPNVSNVPDSIQYIFFSFSFLFFFKKSRRVIHCKYNIWYMFV
jgi:hypothetical protein